jgi:hypothetical protein
MLFTGANAGVRLESMMTSWFEHFEGLRSCLDLLFGLVLGPDMYLESRFLLVAQAIEVFHRLQVGGTSEPSEVWNERKARIVGAVSQHDASSADVAWLTRALEWSNELTLQQRVEVLLVRVNDIASHFLRPNFLKQFKATRNYYTHFDRRQFKNAAHGEDLYWLTEECFALMQAVLLDLLGIGATEAWSWMKRTHRVRSLLEIPRA